MSKFVKRYNAFGWDWYLETDEWELWVSHPVKEHIERLEAENDKLREKVTILVHCMNDVSGCDDCPINGNPYEVRGEWAACDSLRDMLRELGVKV